MSDDKAKNSTINHIFVLLEQTSSKWWCSQAYGLLKRKIIFAALPIFFFLQKMLPRDVDTEVCIS